ncbi:hypothetical protein ABFS82_14G297700 [Erythranthe guttata]
MFYSTIFQSAHTQTRTQYSYHASHNFFPHTLSILCLFTAYCMCIFLFCIFLRIWVFLGYLMVQISELWVCTLVEFLIVTIDCVTLWFDFGFVVDLDFWICI